MKRAPGRPGGNQRICMVTSTHSCLDDRIFHKEAKSLVKSGFPVTIVARASQAASRETCVDGVNIVAVPGPKRGLAARFLVLTRLLCAGRRVSDAFAYHCHESDTLLVGVLLKLITGKKLIYDAHEHFPSMISEHFPSSARPVAMWLLDCFELLLARFADVIITVNGSLAGRFARTGRPITILFNCPSLELYDRVLAEESARQGAESGVVATAQAIAVATSATGTVRRVRAASDLGEDSADIRPSAACRVREGVAAGTLNSGLRANGMGARYYSDGSDGVVVYEGGVSRDRGLDKFLYALAIVKERFPRVRFVVIGDLVGRDCMREWVEGYVREKRIEENFVMTGWVPFEDVPRYLCNADVGVILFQPTHYNNLIGLPNKLFEYMACGKPVVASDFPEIRDAVGTATCGLLVDPCSPEAIAGAVIYLLDHRDEARRMGERGRGAVEHGYSWEVMARRLAGVYRGLCPA